MRPGIERSLAMLSLLLGLVGIRPATAAAADLVVGPFTIETGSKRISSGSFPNISGNPFSRMTVSEYRVTYRGKTVTAGDERARLDRFWDARVLKGAPQPAVLVATTGAWLLTEVDGKLDVRTLVPPATDIVRWQWLDSANGQPGPEQIFSIRDSSAEPREVSDGRLLLLGRRGILDVSTLRYAPVPLTDSAVLKQLAGFHAGNVEVKALSPGRTQVVLVGDRSVDGMFEYALSVFDFVAGAAYPVPFDSNALRFESVWDATPAWLAHYFEWTKDAAGAERVRLKMPVRSRPWQGRLIRSYTDVEYKLYPVNGAIAAPLRALIEGEFGGKRVAPTYGDPNDPNSASYEQDGRRFRVWHDADHRSVAIFAEKINGFTTAGTPALIEKIGARFDELLATGAHQREFTTYPDHR